MQLDNSNCPLCSSSEVSDYFFEERTKREFLKCSCCDLIFLSRKQILCTDTEQSRYENHNNDKRTKGYEKFLRRLVSGVDSQLDKVKFSKASPGLDFGQGPYPMLIEIMREDGYSNLVGYDPFFKPDKELLESKYDYITCCEVVEHMSNPIFEFTTIFKILNPEGVFVVSTGIYDESIDFSKWYYIKDDTHINFFSKKTLSWISERFDVNLKIIEKDLLIFEQK